MPLPKSYGPIQPTKLAEKSDLDVIQPRKVRWVLENVLVALLPYLIGAALAMAGMASWLRATGRLFKPEETVYVKYLGGFDGVKQSPIWGYLAAVPSFPVEAVPWFLMLFIVVVAPRLAKRVI